MTTLRKSLILALALYLALALAACGGEEPAEVVSGPESPAVADASPTSQPPPASPTPAAAPTDAATPTATPLPTDTPTPTPTPTPDRMAEFTARTGAGGLEFARWNRGAVRRMSWAGDTQLLVVAANGQYAYDLEDLSETAMEERIGLALTLEGKDYAIVEAGSEDIVSILQEPESMLAFRYILSPDQSLVATYQDTSVYVWDTASGQRLPAVNVARNVQAVEFGATSNRLLVLDGPADSTGLSVWEPATGEMVWADSNLIDYVHSSALSPDGAWLAVAGKSIPYMGSAITGDARFYLVNLETATPTRVESLDFGFGPFDAGMMAFLDDGVGLLVAEDKSIALLDVTTGQVLDTYETERTVRNMSASPSGSLLALSDRGTIDVLDLQEGKHVATFGGYAASVYVVDFGLDNGRALSVIGDRLQILDIGAAQVVAEHELEEARNALFGPKGSTLIRSGDDQVMVWDYDEGRVLWSQAGSLEGHSTDRTRLLVLQESGSDDDEVSTLLFLDTLSGEVLSEVDLTGNCGTATSADAGLLAVAREDDQEKPYVTLVDLSTGEPLAELDPGGECSVRMDLSPGGQLLAAIASSRVARVWDVGTQELIVEFRHGHSTMSLFGLTTQQTGTPEFVTDDVLATSGGDWDTDELYLWSMPGGERLGGFTTRFNSRTFSADGSLLYASVQSMIGVFDPATGEAVDILLGHDGNVTDILLSPDGTMMLSGSSDGTAILRRLE